MCMRIYRHTCAFLFKLCYDTREIIKERREGERERE